MDKTGVPLLCGPSLKEPEGIAILDPAGKSVPAQFRVLQRWRERAASKDDLSIKWLLVTFLTGVLKTGQVAFCRGEIA